MRVSVRTTLIILATSVSTAALLSACTYTKRQLDYFTNDRKPQVVEGAKRVPALNPQPVSAPAPRQAPVQNEAAPPMVETVEEAPSYEESPYDYFDQEGNRVEPEPAKVMAEPAGESKGDFFSQLSGLFSTESSEVERLRRQPRKPIGGNDYVPAAQQTPPAVQPMTQQPDESMAPMPWTVDNSAPYDEELEPEVVMIAEEPLYPVEDPYYDAPAMPAGKVATLPTVEVETQEEKNWFEKVAEDLGNAFDGEKTEDMAAAEAADEEQYPELSSVPPAPMEYEEVKEEKQRQMEELAEDLFIAAQDRQALYAEPSGQEALQPVEPVRAEPETVMVPQPVEPAASPAGDAMLLGHASDDAQPEAMEEEPAAPVRAAAPVANNNAQGEWWEEWNLFSSHRYTQEQMQEGQAAAPKAVAADAELPWQENQVMSAEEAEEMAKHRTVLDVMEPESHMQPEPAMSASQQWQPVQPEAAQLPPEMPVVEQAPEPVMQEPIVTAGMKPQPAILLLQMDEEPLDTDEQAAPMQSDEVVKPLADVPPATPPVMVPAPADVMADAPMTEEELAELEQDANAVNALPSTDLLHEVKTLPPSRYSRRRDSY